MQYSSNPLFVRYLNPFTLLEFRFTHVEISLFLCFNHDIGVDTLCNTALLRLYYDYFCIL